MKRFYLPFNENERRIILFVFDLIALNLSLLIALVLRPDYSFDLKVFINNPHWFIILTVLWIIAANVFDSYDFSIIGDIKKSSAAAIKSILVTCFVFIMIPFVTPILPPGRRYLFAFILLAALFVVALRALYASLFSSAFFRRRAIIVGTGWKAESIAATIKEFGSDIYDIAGFVSLGNVVGETEYNGTIGGDLGQKFNKYNEGKIEEVNDLNEGNTVTCVAVVGNSREINIKGLSQYAPILGNAQNLCKLIKSLKINSLILAYSGEANGRLFDVLTECMQLGVELIPMTVLYENLTGRVPVEHVGNEWYVAMPINHPGTKFLWPTIKRMGDIVLATVGLIFLAVIFPFVALAIYIDSPGPIFYKQERVGKGGRRFKLIKFRSMVPDAEKEGPVWAKKNDRRVTRVGKMLRRTHVDEFPQFINILKGEMSVVGPRAERPEFVEQLMKEIPFYNARHAVKPGMAGWGLVKQGYGASKEEALVKLQYDLYYIKHQGPWLDAIILLKTILNMLKFKGRG